MIRGPTSTAWAWCFMNCSRAAHRSIKRNCWLPVWMKCGGQFARKHRRVLRTADVYAGPYLAELPDLLVEWNAEAPLDAVSSPKIGTMNPPFLRLLTEFIEKSLANKAVSSR